MKKSFRFLWQFSWVNMAVLAGFAAAVTLGAVASGVPQGNVNIFQTYFGGFPMMALMVLFILSFALCTSNLNLALSCGARRRDFFWGMQSILLAYTLTAWLLQSAMSAIPALMHWSDLGRWTALMTFGNMATWAFPLTSMTVLALGCLCGLLFSRSKVLGSIVMVVAMLVSIAAVMLLMFAAGYEMALYFMDGSAPDIILSPWGRLPLYLGLGLGAVFLVSEYLIWRFIRRYCVR